MSLESFPVELFLALFQYLPTIDLLRAFSNLNQRFTQVLRVYFHTHSCDLHSISKNDFDLVCQHYFPLFVEDIRWLRLSENEETPQAFEQFYGHGWSFKRFPNLKILCIDQVHSLSRLVNDDFSQLTHFDLARSGTDEEFNDVSNMARLLNQLPTLMSCRLDLTEGDELYSCCGQIAASSLRFMSLPDLNSSVRSLVRLISSLSELRSLEVSIDDTSASVQRSSMSFPSIKTLKISYSGSWDNLMSLLQAMPNLTRLRLDLVEIFVDGYRWESFITHNLTHLKTFQLKMITFLHSRCRREDQVDSLLSSFSTRFWLQERRWFVQCDWSDQENCSMVSLYTLPYAFPIFSQMKDAQFKTTFPSESDYRWSFDRISHIYANQCQFLFHCQNLRRLNLTITKDFTISSSPSMTFERLNHLSFMFSDGCEISKTYVKVQELLRCFPHLHSLSMFSWSIDYLCLLTIAHPSIHRLDLRGPIAMFDRQQCLVISQSALGRQCEVLRLGLRERDTLIELMHAMPQLRALTVHFPLSSDFAQSSVQLWLR